MSDIWHVVGGQQGIGPRRLGSQSTFSNIMSLLTTALSSLGMGREVVSKFQILGQRREAGR